MRSGPLLACSALLVALSSPARAETHAPALVRLLHRPGRAHPLADAAGRIPLSVALPAGVDAGALGLLEVAPGIGAIHLPPEEVGLFAAANPSLALGVTPHLHPLLDVSGIWTRVSIFRQATGGLSGRGVIVGVVDTGLDVRHPDFRTVDGHTRVAWMLVSGFPVGRHPEIERAFGCTDLDQSPCAVFSAADIDEVIMAGAGPLNDADGHGSHVTSIAAGNGGVSLPGTPRYVGMAPEATLIFAAPALNGGFADTDILNGTRFIFDRAAAMGLPAGCSGAACVPTDCPGGGCEPVPVVVNLSLGGDYGAHDGTSALEQGLSAFVGDDKPGRAIVVAAGNSGAVGTADDQIVPSCTGAGWICGNHTEAHVTAHETIRVPIVAGAATKGEGFVWITFRPGDDVSVGLEGPGGSTWVGLTARGDQGSYEDGGNQGGVVNDLPSANPSITATNSAVVVFDGSWAAGSELAILLQGSGDALLWVTGQKDSVDGLFFERAVSQGTINVPATAPGLLGVGCTINRLKWTTLGDMPLGLTTVGDDPSPLDDGSCFFSARGPTATGLQKPEISAPGAFVAAAMSAAADPRVAPGGLFDLGSSCPSGEPFCDLVDDRHAIASGTSMSAPHVTGAVALLMELDLAVQREACQKVLPAVPAPRCPVKPTLTQATASALLQAGARHSRGHLPDPDQLGPGSLDLDGALAVFAGDAPASTPADPSKSWYTLSSAYARPDPTWPVWGTIELRRADGTFAAGIDGSPLSLQPHGAATIVQPITQIRPGLLRFAVAARPEAQGESISVEVLYGKASLGVRTLPVGFDVWSASDPTVTAASGACAFPGPGTRHGPGGLVFAALALFASRRRSSYRTARVSERTLSARVSKRSLG